jgi:hypothetical protein
VDVAILRGAAGRWAYFLYALRDGEDGAVFHVEWGPWEPVTFGSKEVMVRGPHRIKRAGVLRAGEAWQELVRRLRSQSNTDESEDFAVIKPVVPQPEVWKQLQHAPSSDGLRKVAAEMRAWVNRERPRITGASDFPRVIAAHAKELLEARRLPSYPHSNRPRSEDKRVEFFSKALAGLELGIAPVTAIKRLHRERFPKTIRSEEEVIFMLRSELESGQIDWKGRKHK